MIIASNASLRSLGDLAALTRVDGGLIVVNNTALAPGWETWLQNGVSGGEYVDFATNAGSGHCPSR